MEVKDVMTNLKYARPYKSQLVTLQNIISLVIQDLFCWYLTYNQLNFFGPACRVCRENIIFIMITQCVVEKNMEINTCKLLVFLTFLLGREDNRMLNLNGQNLHSNWFKGNFSTHRQGKGCISSKIKLQCRPKITMKIHQEK